MRIIAGEFRGRIIDAPEGEGTRPTIDRVRESLFSSLFSMRGGFDDAVVLDAFAGSGALGLEALSRGAQRVVFFERDAKAARVIERNLAGCRVGAPRAQLRKVDVLESAPVSMRPAFNLVFLDPPYATDPAVVAGLVERLRTTGALDVQALVCYEHAASDKSTTFEDGLGVPWEKISSKRYGKVAVDIYERIQG